MPPILAGEYMLEALHEAGTCTQMPEGIMPLKWHELEAYISLTGAIGADWENKLVMELSQEYVSGYNIGLDISGNPPFGEFKARSIISANTLVSLKRARDG